MEPSELKPGHPPEMISEARLRERVRVVGRRISADYAGRDLVVVTVLKGSFVFAADLIREIQLPLRVDFLGVRSYGSGMKSSGVVQITSDLTTSIEGKHVLVVEDIVDTGLTLQFLLKNLATRRPASLALAALLHKPTRQQAHVDIDYLGFTIEDAFVVGYGLDYNERYRNLPYLGTLEGS